MDFTSLLAAAGQSASISGPWYHGVKITDVGPWWESAELFMVILLFIGVLITVYYIQRWIGDY